MQPNKATSTADNTLGGYESDAALWQSRYQIAKSNQTGMFKRFADWFDDFYAVVQTKNYSLWRSKVYIPVLSSKAWALIAKFVALQPGWEVKPRLDGAEYDELGIPEELKQAAYLNQLKLEHDYTNPHMEQTMREKLLSVLVDTAVTGTGLVKVPYVVMERLRYERLVRPDGTIDLANEKVIKKIVGYNDIIPVNIFNVFVAPMSKGLYSAPWIIIKDFKTVNDLKEVNAQKGVEVYKDLDRLIDVRATADEFAVYKKSQNRLTTQTDPIIADRTVDALAIYECYDRSTNEIITFADSGKKQGQQNHWVEIRRSKNIYWHGKYPMVRFTIKPRPHDFWGQGIFETTQRLQRAINDVFNHYLDNWNLSVDGMLMAQESAGINDYIVEPGGLITYRTEEPKQFKFPEPNPASLNQIMSQFMQAVENDTISNYSTGGAASDTDKTRGTKGGILAIQDAADDLTSFMRSGFQDAIRQVGDFWMSNNQQFMANRMTVMANQGRNRRVPVTIDPAKMQGEMQLRVDDASMMPISDDQLKQNYMAFVETAIKMSETAMQQHEALGTPPLVLNFAEILEELADKNGLRNIDAILEQPPTGPTPAQQNQQAEVQQKQQELELKQNEQKTKLQAMMIEQHPTTKLFEQMSYKDVPDDIKRQMEEMAGFQPSNLVANSQEPHIQKANQTVLDHARHLHAQGHLHPSVVDAIAAHLGQQPTPTPPAVPGTMPVEGPGSPVEAPVTAGVGQ